LSLGLAPWDVKPIQENTIFLAPTPTSSPFKAPCEPFLGYDSGSFHRVQSLRPFAPEAKWNCPEIIMKQDICIMDEMRFIEQIPESRSHFFSRAGG
jgi:hypothetical protein